MKKETRHLLLNPGPVTTSDQVKRAQVIPDKSPREKEFQQLITKVSSMISGIAATSDRYQTILFGGSGTAAVEAIISSTVGDGHLCVINNGVYGARMLEMAKAYGISVAEYKSPLDKPIKITELEQFMNKQKTAITHLAVVYHETSTGLLNDIESLSRLCKSNNISLLVDAVSAFGAIPIDMEKWKVSFMAGSANKNIQGLPGISFVIGAKDEFEKLKKVKAKNYYLNLYDQYLHFETFDLFRFTPPVQTLYALNTALEELMEEGVDKRYERYIRCWNLLTNGLKKLGLNLVVAPKHHSKLVSAVYEPTNKSYHFEKMHEYLKQHGITIYKGKLAPANSFRIANIGDITEKDIQHFLHVMEKYLHTI
ncbi:2-aminoethylphosphonate aminotransferase [Alteribacillus sp. YIM 98480]|uniref:2-aminoethylphosphonate aminotransferase n=1 Tax=Alteribacillus sp. YIM 98480 TaxID=2606599 RepID=UPI00131C46A6|nr:2-aminoethylphosphonate--pyruvate transaminase [Alteribacillus sp. YIM 98480]